MDKNESYRQFVEWLTAEQLTMHRYLLTILGDSDAASTVLQEANVVLLEKWEDYTPNTNFGAWSRRVAYLQALALVRDRRRDKLVFSDEMIQQIAQRADAGAETSEERMALRHCLTLLSKGKLELIQQRYRDNQSMAQLSDQMGKSTTSLKVALHRIRRTLMECIRKQLADCR